MDGIIVDIGWVGLNRKWTQHTARMGGGIFEGDGMPFTTYIVSICLSLGKYLGVVSRGRNSGTIIMKKRYMKSALIS